MTANKAHNSPFRNRVASLTVPAARTSGRHFLKIVSPFRSIISSRKWGNEKSVIHKVDCDRIGSRSAFFANSRNCPGVDRSGLINQSEFHRLQPVRTFGGLANRGQQPTIARVAGFDLCGLVGAVATREATRHNETDAGLTQTGSNGRTIC
jgi:hypothetical protein